MGPGEEALRARGVPVRDLTYMERQPTLDEKTFGSGEWGWVDTDQFRETPQTRAARG